MSPATIGARESNTFLRKNETATTKDHGSPHFHLPAANGLGDISDLLEEGIQGQGQEGRLRYVQIHGNVVAITSEECDENIVVTAFRKG
eukprot:scaffold227918_cov60-Attheya_sp.AAC.2